MIALPTLSKLCMRCLSVDMSVSKGCSRKAICKTYVRPTASAPSDEKEDFYDNPENSFGSAHATREGVKGARRIVIKVGFKRDCIWSISTCSSASRRKLGLPEVHLDT